MAIGAPHGKSGTRDFGREGGPGFQMTEGKWVRRIHDETLELPSLFCEGSWGAAPTGVYVFSMTGDHGSDGEDTDGFRLSPPMLINSSYKVSYAVKHQEDMLNFEALPTRVRSHERIAHLHRLNSVRIVCPDKRHRCE
ncbi:hypothetical protein HPP92_000965 [Vanilla planifolia]|uniref:Uncharacterized protein n=1 Tax=Vanilla planifolia TaxID=51239 RepID=A0A835S1M5_VANPL|nr:hypothetical protein HPP92_000965 [Vanilla planifolia]